MPIPVLVAGATATIGATNIIVSAVSSVLIAAGLVAGTSGALKLKEASERIDSAHSRHKRNQFLLKLSNNTCRGQMDSLGKKEIEVVADLKKYFEMMDSISHKGSVQLPKIAQGLVPKYDVKQIKKAAMGAVALKNGLSAAGAGTAAGFAAAGCLTAALKASSISMSGSGLCKSVLSSLVSTSFTPKTTILGVSALSAGVMLLVGGIAFSNLSDDAIKESKKITREVYDLQRKMKKIRLHLNRLGSVAHKYKNTLNRVHRVYKAQLALAAPIIRRSRNWNSYTRDEKLIFENLFGTVSILFALCKVQLVIKNSGKNEINQINDNEINRTLRNAKKYLSYVK